MDGKKESPFIPNFKSIPLDKISTGIDGLDEVLAGGYPVGCTTMTKGGPGSGKTLFMLQFIYQNALKGTPGLFITFEENENAIRRNAATLGWDFPALEERGLLFIFHAKIDNAPVKAGSFSLKALMAIIDGKARSMGAKHLAIDAIDILMRYFEDPSRVHDELNSLHEWLNEARMTVLLSVKSVNEPDVSARFGFLDYMADCVIQLDHRVSEQISTRRLRVLKYRGSAFGTNEYPYIIGASLISLVPIASDQLLHKPLGEYQSSGNTGLDVSLNGGYRRSSCILIAGSAGTGKTTLACTFVQAACARGEKVLYISYEESAEALESAVLSAGIELQPAISAGKLLLCCSLPESTGSDEHLFYNTEILNSFQPDHVVVDAISACHRMGSGKAAFDYCMRLVNACKDRGITCLLTNQIQASSIGEDISGLGFTSLVDTVIQLRFEHEQDGLRRSLLIVKARGSKHSSRFHDFRITDDGIVLGIRTSSQGVTPHEDSGRIPSQRTEPYIE